MTFPDRLDITLLIDGVDFTEYVRPGSLVIDNALTRQVDTLRVYLENPPTTPRDWQEIIVYDGATKIFGGYVISFKDKDGADLGLDHNLSASDYSIRFEHVRIKEQYLNKTDAYIINDIFTKYLAVEGFDVSTYVISLKTHDRIRFNRVLVMDVIKQLADLAGADWYVDCEKKLHFFDTENNSSPFNLSDNPDFVSDYPYNDLELNRDGSGIVNRIEVIGGNYQSEDTTFYLAGTGSENRVIIPFRLHAPDGDSSIQVWRNDGTVISPIWTQLTVKVGYIDKITASDDVLFYFNEKVLEQENPFPDLANAVKITAKYEVPLRMVVQDTISYDHYGMWFDDVINDQNIETKATAKLRGKSKLAQSAYGKSVITLSCDQPGLRSGQTVSIKNALRLIDSTYLIQRVTCTVGIYGRSVFKVTLGTYNPDLIDLLVSLAKRSQPSAPWREDEVLDEVFQSNESLSFDENDTVIESIEPYYFSNDPSEAFYLPYGAFTA